MTETSTRVSRLKMARLPHLQSRYYPPAEEAKAAPTPQYPAEPMQPAAAAPKPQQSNRPNVDAAPRPTQRLDANVGVYVPKGEADPHVYSEFQVKEERVCSPRFVRMTTPSVLLDNSAQTATGLPIACVWQPLAEVPQGEDPIPVVDVSKKGPFRCSRCLAYANPFFISYDSQRTVTCNMCSFTQPMPVEFLSERDAHQELVRGTCDFLVPSSYVTKPPQLNIFFLCIDVSADSLANGLPQSVLTSLKSSLQYIPVPERSRVGVMTYSETFSYYRPAATLQEIVIREGEEPFVSDPIEGLSFALDSQISEFESFLDALIDKLNRIEKPAKSLLSPAAIVTAAKEALTATGGRVLLFTTGLGTVGLMKLAARDDTRLYNTEKERTLFIPQTDAIYDLGRDCSTLGITLDVFACAAQPYLDIASLYPLVTITGGDLHYFSHFSVQDSEKLHFQLVRTLTRPQVFQALMRARCSNGLTVDSYIGHYNRKGATDMEVAVLDADKAFAVVLKHEERLKEGNEYYVQCAMLYTNLEGQRLIRVCNTVVKASAQVSKRHVDNMYSTADVNTLHNVLLKQHLMKLLDEPMKTIREQWHSVIVSFLLHYRMNGNAQITPGQMAFPENLGTLPLLTISAMKQQAFSLSRVGPDGRMAAVAKFKGMPIVTSFLLSYPRIYSVHDLLDQPHQPGTIAEDGLVLLPDLVAASSSKLLKSGAYLMDNGQVLVLFVGPEVGVEFLTEVFGVATIEEVESITVLPDLSSDLSQRLQAIISELHRRNPGAYETLTIIPDTAPSYYLHSALLRVKSLLVEDSTPSEMSYGDYLLNLNRVLINKMENK